MALPSNVLGIRITQEIGHHNSRGRDVRGVSFRVSYKNGTYQYFSCSREEFFRWRNSGWRTSSIPDGVYLRYPSEPLVIDSGTFDDDDAPEDDGLMPWFRDWLNSSDWDPFADPRKPLRGLK